MSVACIAGRSSTWQLALCFTSTVQAYFATPVSRVFTSGPPSTKLVSFVDGVCKDVKIFRLDNPVRYGPILHDNALSLSGINRAAACADGVFRKCMGAGCE